MDKQPPFTGWREGLSAYDPKIIDDKLYARGAGDDHYAILASAIAIKTIQECGLKHPRIVMTFEADEESGSDHIEHYLAKLKDRIGDVDLIVCLDSGCLNYE
jgi:acetylornithine deacetylase/succinyl-diaminopimelate desuccinylase-like protein